MNGDAPGDWIEGWIAQQRELVEKLTSQAAANGVAVDPALSGLGLKWLDAGQAYLQGWAQFVRGPASPGASGTSPEPAPSALGEELLSAWQGAWAGLRSSGAGAAQAFSELLRQTPPIGLAREHSEAWRELSDAQAQCQKLEQELRTVLLRVQTDALALLEKRVGELRRSGKDIASYRELYDLWVDCSEQVYADVAHSEPYCRLQAELGNATMRLRTRLQSVVEGGLRHLDLPTRSELNTVHRQVRELRERIADLEQRLSESRQGPAT